MEFKQVYEITNDMVQEYLGEEAILEEDLSNIASIGQSFISVLGLDNYVRSINDRIAKVVMVDRVYEGVLPSVMRDGWEFGSIVEKLSWDSLPEAEENESWELEDRQSYDPNIFYKPSIIAKCWNQALTFEIPISLTEKQIKTAFTSAQELGRFYSMIETGVKNAMTLRKENLIMRTVNAMAAETFADESGNTGDGKTGIKAINLFTLWNDAHSGEELYTVEDALKNKEFIRFAVAVINDYSQRIKRYSRLYNVDGRERFTPDSKLNIALHSLLKTYADVYLQSDTFNAEYTALKGEAVPFWQATGTDDSIETRTEIKAKSPSGDSVDIKGCLAIMFDRDACAVCCENGRVTSNYNAKAEFVNEYHKWDARHLVATDENCIVFYCEATAS